MKAVMTFIRDFIECIAANIRVGFGEIQLGDVLWRSYSTNTPVYCGDDIVTIHGTPSRLPGSISCLDTGGNPIIVVNKVLLSSPKWMIDAMIAHEEGHVIFHVNDANVASALFRCVVTPAAEFEADEYARQRNTEIIRTLQFFQECGLPNLDKRIEALQKSSIKGDH